MTFQPERTHGKINRRSFLKVTGVITASTAVSGCLGDGGDGDDGGGDGDDSGGGDGDDGGGDGDDGDGGDGDDGGGDSNSTSDLAFQQEGFEDDDMSQWEVHDEAFKRTTVVAHSGQFSAGAKVSGAEELATGTVASEGAQISRLEYYWWETSESTGGGTRLLNSDGDVEIGIGTGNPVWRIDDQTGISRELGETAYETWVQTSVEFDWENGFATVTLQDPNNEDNSYSNDHPLKSGNDIQAIQLHGFNGSEWQSGIDMNWDDFVIEL